MRPWNIVTSDQWAHYQNNIIPCLQIHVGVFNQGIIFLLPSQNISYGGLPYLHYSLASGLQVVKHVNTGDQTPHFQVLGRILFTSCSIIYNREQAINVDMVSGPIYWVRDMIKRKEPPH